MTQTTPSGQGERARNASLARRFMTLWQRCLLPGSEDRSDLIWATLLRGYTQPDRRYHTEQHIAHCLEQLDLVVDRTPRLARIELAIWFHDVVYEPGQPDNEARSADLFRHFASDLMDPELVDEVTDLIMATTHSAPVDGDAKQMICDIDLSSFGLPWPLFQRDSDNLRFEFRGSENAHCLGRRRFMEALLKRPRIFMTEFFNERYEHQARENIRRSLADADG